MKTIGFVDYYISEWHANNYPNWIKEANEKLGEDFVVKYAWAELDKSLVDGVTTDEWCEKFGVEKCGSIQELCEKADYILVLAPSNPEKHLGYAQEVLKYKKNTYIDKTFTPDYATAKQIFDIAAANGTKFFSTSALRYADELADLTNAKAMFTVGGGSNLDEYIIHQVEMVVKTLKEKAIAVRVEKQGAQYVCSVKFENEKTATLLYADGCPFVAGAQLENGLTKYCPIRSDFFKNLIADILHFYLTGKTPFDTNETLEVMKVREGIVKAKDTLGAWVQI